MLLTPICHLLPFLEQEVSEHQITFTLLSRLEESLSLPVVQE